jgi:hypothetical protein
MKPFILNGSGSSIRRTVWNKTDTSMCATIVVCPPNRSGDALKVMPQIVNGVDSTLISNLKIESLWAWRNGDATDCKSVLCRFEPCRSLLVWLRARVTLPIRPRLMRPGGDYHNPRLIFLTTINLSFLLQ